jgi:hypothetical protein
MKKLLQLSLQVIVFTVLTSESCNGPQFKELLPGYTFYDAPNDLDKPGLIFRVTPQGERFDVTYLNVTPQQGRIEIKELEQEKTLSLNAIASFLHLSKSQLQAKGSLDLSQKVTFKIKMSSNTQEKLDDFDIDQELTKTTDIIKKNMEAAGRSNDAYYIIRESVSTQNLEYGFNKKIVNDIGFKVAIESLMDVNAGVKVDNNKDFQLTFNYPKPMRVFYKAERLNMLSSVTGTIKITRSPVVSNEIYNTYNKR